MATKHDFKSLIPQQQSLDEIREDEQFITAGHIIQITRYDIDAQNRGGSIFLLKQGNPTNENALGLQIIKLAMPFELFEHVESKHKSGEYPIPAFYRILCEMRAGGAQKAANTALMLEYAPKQIEWVNDKKITDYLAALTATNPLLKTDK